MWLHRIFGTIILILTIAMGILGIKQNNWTLSGETGHYVIGLIIFFATFFVAVGGVAARSVTRRKVWRTKFIHKFQSIHKVRPCLVLTYYAAWGKSHAYPGAGIYSAGSLAFK
jgi:amino acid transporter